MKASRLKATEGVTTTLIAEDIQRIVDHLKEKIEEEHLPLVAGVEQAISAQKRMQEETTKQIIVLSRVLEEAKTLATPHGRSPTPRAIEATSRLLAAQT